MPAYKNYHGWVTLDYDISVKAAKRQTGGKSPIFPTSASETFSQDLKLSEEVIQ